ncbi:MAG: hypothetical protein R6V84_12600 [Desulfobacterales bacterium]
MKWFRTKAWKPLDLACLKWSSILFGMIIGAYLSDFTKRFVWLFAAAVIALAVRPLLAWFRDER